MTLDPHPPLWRPQHHDTILTMTKGQAFDVVVVGAGVFGAWTAYQLSHTGAAVLLLDAYGPGNSRASSGGESRIIRMGYGPDEIYTRSAQRSLIRWCELFDSFSLQASCGWRASMIHTAMRPLECCNAPAYRLKNFNVMN